MHAVPALPAEFRSTPYILFSPLQSRSQTADMPTIPSSSGKGRTVNYALTNKAAILAHMEKQRQKWDTAVDDLSTDEPSGNIRVFVRVRPLHVGQDSKNSDIYSLVDVQAPRTVHVAHPSIQALTARVATKTFEADGVLPPDADNASLWASLQMDATISSVLNDGRTFYLCAYGQTGSGKTFSTTSLEERLCDSLLADQSSPVLKVSLSAFEMRGGSCYDLLSEPSFAPVKIQGAADDTFVGLSSHDVADAGDLLDLVRKAGSLRTTRSTIKNDTSSRSHSIMQYIVHMKDGGKPATICIIDLAGSERAATSSANADPSRLREAIEVNKSLSSLKECIRARLSGDSRVPWRGSKLTMVLRRAFGSDTASVKKPVDSGVPEAARGDDLHADTQLVVLACVSPSVFDVDDTIGTLNYISPFQLAGKEAIEAMQSQRLAPLRSDDPRQWSHEESVEYIKRRLTKLAPLLPRILPDESRTLGSVLLPLATPEELVAMLSTPAPGEAAAPNVRHVLQAKANAGAYHAKLRQLLEAAEAADARGAGPAMAKMRAVGSTRRDALDALSGRKPGTNVSAESRMRWDGSNTAVLFE